MSAVLKVPAKILKSQLHAIFEAWGMSADQADMTAETLTRADLLGIDSHGITLIPFYADLIASGRLTPRPEIRIARSFGATAVIDGGGGFGEAPAVRAMELAIEKAQSFGIGAVGGAEFEPLRRSRCLCAPGCCQGLHRAFDDGGLRALDRADIRA